MAGMTHYDWLYIEKQRAMRDQHDSHYRAWIKWRAHVLFS